MTKRVGSGPTFTVGTRVRRPTEATLWLPPRRWRYRTGTVVVLRTARSRFGVYPELYDVRWDDTGAVERGYLPHGLERLKDQSRKT